MKQSKATKKRRTALVQAGRSPANWRGRALDAVARSGSALDIVVVALLAPKEPMVAVLLAVAIILKQRR